MFRSNDPNKPSEPRRVLKKETLRHREAFDYYYSLGQKRTYDLVAKKFGVTPHVTVYRWATSFDWANRVIERDARIAKKLESDTDRTVIKAKREYSKVVQASIANYVKDLREGNLAAENAHGLDKLIRLDLYLMGEADQRYEVKGDWKAEFIARAHRIIERRGFGARDGDGGADGGDELV